MSGAFEVISAGGTADGTTISNGAILEVFGATANVANLVLSAGGIFQVAGGYDLTDFTAFTTFADLGIIQVLSGGIVDGLSISNGTEIIVSNGGSAGNLSISNGGELEVLGGAIITAANAISAGGSSTSAPASHSTAPTVARTSYSTRRQSSPSRQTARCCSLGATRPAIPQCSCRSAASSRLPLPTIW